MHLTVTRRAFAGLLAAAPWLAAQQGKPTQEEEMATIQVDVDLVNLLCSVRDKKGALIATLTKDDFEIFEEGQKQSIKYFTRETNLPLTIGLLVDVSGSQANLIDVERQAAAQFFANVLGKKDLAFLISFGSDAELLQDLTGSPRLLESALKELRLNSQVTGIDPGPVPTATRMHGTVLYDAVYLAATERLRDETGRKAIVLITDGVDQGSKVKLETAIESAQKANSIVYAIYYVDPRAYYQGGFYGGYSDSSLKKMAEQTGGRVLKVDRKHSLEDIFREIQEEMRSQYSIGYTPSDSDRKPGDFRKVEIRTTDRKLKVYAREGYFVEKRRA